MYKTTTGKHKVTISTKHLSSKISPVLEKTKCQKICLVCKHTSVGTRKNLSYHCSECDIALCLIPPLKYHHTNRCYNTTE